MTDAKRVPNWRRFLKHVAWPYTEADQNVPETFAVADGAHVRMSLPWHGTASWDSLHEYVTAVILDNYVPGPDRAGYGTPEQQAAKSARAILLSICHRLKIEPVGAFTPKDDDDD